MNIFATLVSYLPDKIAGDFSFLLFFIVGSLVFAFILGKTRLINAVVFSYVSFALLLVFPSSVFSFSPYGRAIVFGALLVILVAFGDYILDIHISNPTSTFLGRILIMGCLAAGLAMSMLLFFVPASLSLQFLSPTVYSYFGTTGARIAWMMAPLIFLLFINKRKR